MKAMETQAVVSREMLEKVWQRSLPIVMDRLNVLDAGAAALQAGHLSNELRAQTIMEAHRLAGSLGMFGYDEGTRLAREIETMLESHVDLGDGSLVGLTKNLRASLFP